MYLMAINHIIAITSCLLIFNFLLQKVQDKDANKSVQTHYHCLENNLKVHGKSVTPASNINIKDSALFLLLLLTLLVFRHNSEVFNLKDLVIFCTLNLVLLVIAKLVLIPKQKL